MPSQPQMSHTEIVRLCEQQEPDLWRAVYPRIYRNTESYGSPRIPAAVAVTALTWLRDHGWQSAPATIRHIYYGVTRAMGNQMPSLYVAPALLAAVGQSEPPADVLWTEMRLPYEAGYLMLPSGALRHPDGVEAGFLGWARCRAGEPLRFGSAFPHVGVREDVFVVWTGLASGNLPILDSVLNAATTPHLGDAHHPGEARTSDYQLPLSTSESEFLQQCRTLVFGLLLSLDARPALLSRGSRVGTHPKSRREIWEPNIVGCGYQSKRERASSASASMHASPRAHWRRGHYRSQPFGIGRTETRTIWIEPTLIGAED